MLNFVSQRVTSGFNYEAVENCALQGYFAVSSKKLPPLGV
jgi:hypothetical protein